MATSQAVALIFVAGLLVWGWAVLCWTLRTMHARLAEALARQQEINAAQARQIWSLVGASRGAENAQAAAMLHSTSMPPATIDPTGAYEDDTAMSRM